MINIKLPVDEETIRQLRVGDEVTISGEMVTARDVAHKYMTEEKPDWLVPILRNSMIYHCGPVMKKSHDGEWTFVAAGPTTSSREEPYEAGIIKRYQLRGVIGKGGMGEKTQKALRQHGCVYLHAVGGLAVTLARAIVRVVDVYRMEEHGIPEAFWHIEVNNFPALVTMDSHGKSLHRDMLEKSTPLAEKLARMKGNKDYR